ncbi:YezD family protein [Candidatus Methylocalor cossyra]|uniref:DUF2292 domain-containing protein n=1 Tax=Candidatus Methylocalor cossyra TaxID=3108543 RepID=A0ABM9NMA9_9GAMM
MGTDNQPPPRNPEPTAIAAKVLAALRGLRFGSVEITVHEGRVVQIERKEKLRLSIPCPDGNGSGDPEP